MGPAENSTQKHGLLSHNTPKTAALGGEVMLLSMAIHLKNPRNAPGGRDLRHP